MEESPEAQSPIFLSRDKIKRKFEELAMFAYLNDTCDIRGSKVNLTLPYVSIEQQRKHTAWRVDTHIRRSDRKSQAIVYWRETAGGDPDFEIEQFTAPDGKFYVVDCIKRPGVSSAGESET